MCYILFFFFKQKTAYEMRISDWSSDVCSSDLTRSRPSGLLLDVHAVEDVTAEGIDLEVLHFLAHRLEHHRMCDGGPGRLLLEEDLSLLVELRPDRKSVV